jgi:hypothetical protein
MQSDKDYYRILGVLDDAEDIVIRATYKVLAQKYHPDRWQGDAGEATRRMAEINTAYAVLSDAEKRAAYDSTRDKNQFRDEPPEAEDANEADVNTPNSTHDKNKKPLQIIFVAIVCGVAGMMWAFLPPQVEVSVNSGVVRQCNVTWSGRKFIGGKPEFEDYFIAIQFPKTADRAYVPKHMNVTQTMIRENLKEIQKYCPNIVPEYEKCSVTWTGSAFIKAEPNFPENYQRFEVANQIAGYVPKNMLSDLKNIVKNNIEIIKNICPIDESK